MAGRRIVWIGNVLIVSVITIAFVITFGQAGGGGGTPPVAEVDGERISIELFRSARNNLEDFQRQQLPPGTDLSQFASQLDSQTLQQLIRRMVLTQEASALGLRVSDEELRNAIRSNPGFQREGRFDPETFKRYVRLSWGSESLYLEERRRDLLLVKFLRTVLSPVRISDAAVREAILNEKLRIRLHYVEAAADQHKDPNAIDTAAINAFEAENAERIDAKYQQRFAEFNRPEEVKARHILFTGENALERAQTVLEKLNSGETFDEMARQFSQDDETRFNGGDLGYFPRGRMLAAFETAAFSLEIGALSQPIETSSGVHLIRMDERREALEKPLTEVSSTIAKELLVEDQAREKARALAQGLQDRLVGGEAFAEAAKALGLAAQESVAFGVREASIPGIGTVPGLKSAALNLRADAPHAGRIFDSGNRFFVIALLERDEPDADAIETESSAARERIETATRAQLEDAWYRVRFAELQQAGKVTTYSVTQ